MIGEWIGLTWGETGEIGGWNEQLGKCDELRNGGLVFKQVSGVDCIVVVIIKCKLSEAVPDRMGQSWY